MLISYNMCSSNNFSISIRFPCFSRSGFFRVQVFQGTGFSGSRFLGFGSRVRFQVIEVAIHRQTPVRESFLMEFQAQDLQIYLKETRAQVFSCEILESLKNSFFNNITPCVMLLEKRVTRVCSSRYYSSFPEKNM